jgi:hypothetical protein
MRRSCLASSTLFSSISLLLSYTLSISLFAPFAVRKVEAASPAKAPTSSLINTQVASETGRNRTQDAGIGTDPASGIDRGSSERFRVTPPAPKQGAPLPDLPNLDEIRTRQHPAPKAPAPIPSTLRRCQHSDPNCNSASTPAHPTRPVHPMPLPVPSAPTGRSLKQAPASTTDSGYEPLLASLNLNWWEAIASLSKLDAGPVSDSPFSIQLPALALNQMGFFPALAMQSGSTPYTSITLPGTVEIEHFDNGGEGVAYHDTSAGTHGQDYDQPYPYQPPPSFRQPTDVDIYHSAAGYSNGYLIVMQAGDWMNYTVQIAQSGTYTLEAQTYYWGSPGGTFHVEVDGVDKTGQLQLPGGSTSQTVTRTGIQLSAGQHVLKVVCETNGSDGYYMGDIDFLRFIRTANINVARASNGAVATASSTTPNSQFPGYNFLPSVAIDGDRKSGVNFWRDYTANAYPDWLQIDFQGSKSIDEIDVFTLQDNDQNPSEPTESMTFSLHGITAFDVQYWNGSAWVTVPQGSVSGNNKVWRKFTFPAVTTGSIRILINNALNSYSRIVEVEAYQSSTEATAAHWKMDEGTGTVAADSSGKGNTGTVSGAAWSPGKVGTNALTFNGTSDYVSVASNTSLTSIVNNFTVSFWANPNQSYTHEIDPEGTWGIDGVYNQRYLFGPYPYTDGTAGAGISIGSNGVSVYEHAGNYMPATLVYQAPISGWTHVTLVYQNKQPRLYINGSLVRTGQTSPMAAVHINPLNLGGFSYGYYAGQVDDVRIYGSVLSGAEIQSLATQSDGGQTTYRASTDFSTSQGYRNWYYLDSNNNLMTFDAANNWWTGMEGGSSCCLILWSTGGHPGAYTDAVRQWRAPQAGSIRISGTATVPGYGDGVVVTIRKGSNQLWQQTIAGGNSTGVSFDLTTSVTQGDRISFVINRNGTSMYDSTGLDPTITFTPSSSEPAIGYADYAAARLDAANRTGTGGEDLLSGNYNWTLPLVNLRGRAGLDLGLALSYNSLVWTRSGTSITYDMDEGFPSPGFRLGFPTIEPLFYNSQTGKYAYLLVTPSGSRVELRQNTSSPNLYESADSSYLQFDASQMILRTTDGTQLSYPIYKGEAYRCTQIKDRNGNFITVNYYNDDTGRISTITDTLARTVTFNYDSNLNLISITAQRNGQTQPWPVATFGYGTQTIQTNFNGLTSNIQNGTTIPVLTQVGLDDGHRYNFSYMTWGQVSRIDHYVQDNVNTNNWILLNYVSYNLPANNSTAQSDCPRYTEKRVWGAYWNGDGDGLPVASEEAVTAFSGFNFESGWRQMIVPDGTAYKEFFATTGWQRGLTSSSEVWSGGVKQKWTTLSWTQDNTSLAYQLNPRPTETNIYDASNNRRRTTIDYGAYAAYGLPYLVTEYGGPNATTLMRQTYTDYQLGTDYVNRHIIGLVSAQHISDGQTWLSKIVYTYDAAGAQLVATSSPAIQHDPAYDTFTGTRGLLTSVYRYDATDLSNTGKATVTQIGYNTDGSVIFTRDPEGHQTTISYTDSFSDTGSHPATFAYPTTVTDADGYASSTQYDYYLGAVSRTVDPKGATAVNLYDAAGRIDRIYNTFNGAFNQYHYGPRYVVTYTSVRDLQTPVYAISVTNGLGQVYASAQDAPVPGEIEPHYSAQYLIYDVMGRVVQQSRPTEIRGGWYPSGDDAAGWVMSLQTYDWKGRPRVKTNPDGTTTEAIYGGCGCAGGEVIETRDEIGRRQRATSDPLGRVIRTEVLNSNGATYSTATTTYNALDQVTRLRQYQGTEGSGLYQETLMTYDGYARLASRKLPQQTSATTYTYYADDLLQSRTDARGATATYSYNGRHLPTSSSYRMAGSADIDVAYGYDEVGNRTRMADASGISDYHYDQLSRMDWEKRTVNGITGANNIFQISYGYDLGGNLTSVTYPFNAALSYSRDHTGRVTDVTANGFGNTSQFASDLRYRAWGALKSMTYGSSLSLSLDYDGRLRPTSSRLSSSQSPLRTGMQTDYQYYADGTLRFAHDLADERFDRAYSYDEVGRVKEAYSGSEARDFINQTQTPSPSGPYRQSYSYNVWGNMTGRQNRYWNKWDNFGASYVDGKNTDPLWEYNADGRLKQDKDLSYKYDAAGSNVEVRQLNDAVINSQVADVDGQVVKKVVRNVTAGTTITTYYVRSSVLGGRVIAEVNSAGQKQKRNIYLGAEVLASEGVGGAITWKHEAALTGSEGVSVAGGGYSAAAEYDPTGVNVGLEAPTATGGLFDAEMPTLIDSNGGAGGMRCTVDGLVMDCGWAQYLQGVGAIAQCSNNDCGPRWGYSQLTKRNEWKFFGSFADGYEGYAPLGAVSNGRGGIWIDGIQINAFDGAHPLLAHSSQITGPRFTPDACGDMADYADTAARTAVNHNTSEDDVDYNSALKEFDAQFSRLYVGHPMTDIYKITDLAANGPRDRTQSAFHFGQTGFRTEFKEMYRDAKGTWRVTPDFVNQPQGDPLPQDQTHHAVTMLSAGINGANIISGAYVASGIQNRGIPGLKAGDNPGDVRLTNAAYELGKHLRKNSWELLGVGDLIRARLCDPNRKPAH